MSNWCVILYPIIGLAISCIVGGYQGLRDEDIIAGSLAMMFIWPLVVLMSLFTWIGRNAKKYLKV